MESGGPEGNEGAQPSDGEKRLHAVNAVPAPIGESRKEAGGRPGFIFNLGHGILPGTPLENVQYLVDTVRTLGRR